MIKVELFSFRQIFYVFHREALWCQTYISILLKSLAPSVLLEILKIRNKHIFPIFTVIFCDMLCGSVGQCHPVFVLSGQGIFSCCYPDKVVTSTEILFAEMTQVLQTLGERLSGEETRVSRSMFTPNTRIEKNIYLTSWASWNIVKKLSSKYYN